MNKNIYHHAKPGFILVSVFIMMAIASFIVIQLTTRASIYNVIVPVMYDRSKARSLALSGVTIALNQLAMQDDQVLASLEENQKNKKEDKKSAEERKRDFFLTLLMIQNKWHKFEMKEEQSEIGIYITCEEGKIPLNGLMDFTTKTFITLQKPALFKAQECLESICKKIEERTKDKDPYNFLKNALNQRSYAFVGIQELLEDQSFSYFKEKMYPPFPSDVASGKNNLFLQDLFTLCHTQPVCNPWLASVSVKNILDLKEEKKMDLKEYHQIVKSLDFSKTSLSQEWDKGLKKVYNKSYTALPEKIVGLLTAKFEPRFFSVLSYGKVGSSEQRLCAYIERVWTDNTETFKVRNIYWL